MRSLLILPVLALFPMVLSPTAGSAQARGSVQVAARLLAAEPSRTALAVAVQTLGAPSGTRSTRSRLARVRVEREPASGAFSVGRRKVVRIDFLRN